MRPCFLFPHETRMMLSDRLCGPNYLHQLSIHVILLFSIPGLNMCWLRFNSPPSLLTFTETSYAVTRSVLPLLLRAQYCLSPVFFPLPSSRLRLSPAYLSEMTHYCTQASRPSLSFASSHLLFVPRFLSLISFMPSSFPSRPTHPLAHIP